MHCPFGRPLAQFSSSGPLYPRSSGTHGSFGLGQHRVLSPCVYQKGYWLPPLLPMLSGAQGEAPDPDCPNLRLGTGL